MRVVIVHNADDMQIALTAAEELESDITLQTAPGALDFAGSLYLYQLFEQAKEAAPHAKAHLLLDCGNSQGLALQAMQTGHTHIRSSAPQEIREKLAAIAAENGISFTSQPYESLDLQQVRSKKDACIKWLQKDHCT